MSSGAFIFVKLYFY